MDNCNSIVNEPLTKPEIEQVAQLKRFHEWLQANSSLRHSLASGNVTPAELSTIREIGVTLNLDDMSFFWKYNEHTTAYLLLASKGRLDEADEETAKIIEKYPLLKLWGKFTHLRCSLNVSLDYWGQVKSGNDKFDAWRQRRIVAAKSELGYFGMQIGHPVLAFELNEGCSVGCWFCSFATHKLSGTLDYTKERDEVLSIVSHCADIFGKEMAAMALPYYRTEPHDNPHYLDFLKDYEKTTGAVLCTSTAVCHDIEWIKNLLKFYQRGENCVYCWPRLSILSLEMLRKVHTAFTPMEIKDIELLIQVKDHERPKVTGGRILEEQAGLRAKEDFSDRKNLAAQVPQGTIACVSGFNINLVTRTIMLFSPCYASKKWPYGFRVYGKVKYRDAKDFPDAIKSLIERYMPLTPPKDKILKFRDDIIFRKTENGFDLATANQLHHFKGQDKYGPLGELIAAGAHTYAQINEEILKNYKVNPIILRTVVQKLFDDGFIDEVYEESQEV